jgi:hypothetical protein
MKRSHNFFSSLQKPERNAQRSYGRNIHILIPQHHDLMGGFFWNEHGMRAQYFGNMQKAQDWNLEIEDRWTKDLYKGLYCSGALVPFADLEK